jgi:hypothetical protein
MALASKGDLPDGESEIFFDEGMDRRESGAGLICPSGKSLGANHFASRKMVAIEFSQVLKFSSSQVLKFSSSQVLLHRRPLHACNGNKGARPRLLLYR